MHPLSHVLETSLYADDLAAAEHFYHGVLGLEVLLREAGRHVFFRCGTSVVLVFNPEATQSGTTLPPHGATGPGHAAFAVAHDDFDSWKAHIVTHGVDVEKEMTWPNGGRSLYVRDPTGNSVELATPDLWGEATRDDRLRQIRPAVPDERDAAPPMERFERLTLRPLCALQRPLILQIVADHLRKIHPTFSEMDGEVRERTVRDLLERDRRLRHTLIGATIGHFTAEEYAFYRDHEREVWRRIVALLTACVSEHLDVRPGMEG